MTTARPTLCYLTAIEDVVRSPLVHSQVVDLLFALAEAQPQWQWRWAALYPLPNYLRFHRRLTDLRRRLAAADIVFTPLPLLHLTRHFYIPRRWLPGFQAQARLAGRWLAGAIRPDLIHCRSYPAALVGVQLARRSHARLLFDARSLYPEEGVVAAEQQRAALFDAAAFRRWKTLETALLEAADLTTAVSAAMRDLLIAEHPQLRQRIITAPISTLVPAAGDLQAWRAATRSRLGIPDDVVVVAYVGSWFQPERVLPLLQRLARLLPEQNWHSLLLVSASQLAGNGAPYALANQIATETAGRMACTALSVPHNQVYAHLAAADLALIPQGSPLPDAIAARRIQSTLSIKFTEYLACGLPVLASNYWAGAAADLVAKERLGILYDQVDDDVLRAWLQQYLAAPQGLRQHCHQFAAAHFALPAVAAHYLTLYRDLLA